MFCSLVLPDVDILESYIHRIPSEKPALLKDLSPSSVILANVARLGQALSEEDGSKKRVAKEPITRCTWNLSFLVPEQNSDLGVQPLIACCCSKIPLVDNGRNSSCWNFASTKAGTITVI